MQITSTSLALAIWMVICAASFAETPARWSQSFDAGYVDNNAYGCAYVFAALEEQNWRRTMPIRHSKLSHQPLQDRSQ